MKIKNKDFIFNNCNIFWHKSFMPAVIATIIIFLFITAAGYFTKVSIPFLGASIIGISVFSLIVPVKSEKILYLSIIFFLTGILGTQVVEAFVGQLGDSERYLYTADQFYRHFLSGNFAPIEMKGMYPFSYGIGLLMIFIGPEIVNIQVFQAFLCSVGNLILLRQYQELDRKKPILFFIIISLIPINYFLDTWVLKERLITLAMILCFSSILEKNKLCKSIFLITSFVIFYYTRVFFIVIIGASLILTWVYKTFKKHKLSPLKVTSLIAALLFIVLFAFLNSSAIDSKVRTLFEHCEDTKNCYLYPTLYMNYKTDRPVSYLAQRIENKEVLGHQLLNKDIVFGPQNLLVLPIKALLSPNLLRFAKIYLNTKRFEFFVFLEFLILLLPLVILLPFAFLSLKGFFSQASFFSIASFACVRMFNSYTEFFVIGPPDFRYAWSSVYLICIVGIIQLINFDKSKYLESKKTLVAWYSLYFTYSAVYLLV